MTAGDPRFPEICIACPDWVPTFVGADRPYADDDARMRLAIGLARHNVEQRTGGPFGAAIFEADSGRLVGVGVNRVVPANNAVLHAEIVAFMMAQQRVGHFTLAAPHLPDHVLYTSCEPCAMCLGATQWSGVRRVVWAATRDDANRIAFDEGPVFRASYDYLRQRGIEFHGELLRDEARAVLDLYERSGGAIYNG
jgi:tRNA(Arg) A34 adenosine deaminase TadA